MFSDGGPAYCRESAGLGRASRGRALASIICTRGFGQQPTHNRTAIKIRYGSLANGLVASWTWANAGLAGPKKVPRATRSMYTAVMTTPKTPHTTWTGYASQAPANTSSSDTKLPNPGKPLEAIAAITP